MGGPWPSTDQTGGPQRSAAVDRPDGQSRTLVSFLFVLSTRARWRCSCAQMCNLPEYLKIALFQFRIGTYKLPANNKFNNISIDEQICTTCDKGDEIHFTFECDRLRYIRHKYIPTSFT